MRKLLDQHFQATVIHNRNCAQIQGGSRKRTKFFGKCVSKFQARRSESGPNPSHLCLISEAFIKSICLSIWCCYIPVDSAMAASQNGFCSYKLSSHKKTNVLQTMTKTFTIFIYLIFYHREIVKRDHFMTLSLSYATPFCDAAVAKSTVLQQHLRFCLIWKRMF